MLTGAIFNSVAGIAGDVEQSSNGSTTWVAWLALGLGVINAIVAVLGFLRFRHRLTVAASVVNAWENALGHYDYAVVRVTSHGQPTTVISVDLEFVVPADAPANWGQSHPGSTPTPDLLWQKQHLGVEETGSWIVAPHSPEPGIKNQLFKMRARVRLASGKEVVSRNEIVMTLASQPL